MSGVLHDAAGPAARRRHRLWSAATGLVVLALAAYAVHRLDAAGKLAPGLWAVLGDPDLLGLLGQGLLATLAAAGTALVLSLAGGALLAAGLLSRPAWLRIGLRGWLEVFRGLPLLLLIFFIFLGMPVLGVDVSTFWALVGGLALYNSAVIAEIFRAGILSLPRGQAEAAAAIGLMPLESFRIILLPQAVRRMLPTLISQIVTLLKETSFGFVVGYTELLRNARSAIEFLGGDYSLPVYTLVAVAYVAVNAVLSAAAYRLEARLGR